MGNSENFIQTFELKEQLIEEDELEERMEKSEYGSWRQQAFGSVVLFIASDNSEHYQAEYGVLGFFFISLTFAIVLTGINSWLFRIVRKNGRIRSLRVIEKKDVPYTRIFRFLMTILSQIRNFFVISAVRIVSSELSKITVSNSKNPTLIMILVVMSMFFELYDHFSDVDFEDKIAKFQKSL